MRTAQTIREMASTSSAMYTHSRAVHSADTYLRMQPHDYDFRFDTIAINGTPESYTVEHIPDAYLPSLRRY